MRKLLLAVLLLSISCTNPLCGCSPERFAVVLRGTLRDAVGAPLGGHRIRSETAFGGCADYFQSSGALTAADGGFAFLVDAPPRDSVCVRLFARDSVTGAVETPVGGTLRIQGTEFPWDTLDLSLTFAPVMRSVGRLPKELRRQPRVVAVDIFAQM
jgi:hypothetical protein